MHNFKDWLSKHEVFLNPLMYNMDTPEGRAEYDKEKSDLEQWASQRQQKREVQREPHHTPIILKCWRGCTKESLAFMTVSQNAAYRILDAKKSRSGALWFTHQYQPGAKEYADDHGEVVIAYPLKCTAYYDTVKYSNGQTTNEPSKEMSEKVQVYSECPFAIFGDKVVQTPPGWTFSEHGEKHVICETLLKISNEMISLP